MVGVAMWGVVESAVVMVAGADGGGGEVGAWEWWIKQERW